MYRGVPAPNVVEGVDVVADRQRGTGATFEVIDSFELALERREEARPGVGTTTRSGRNSSLGYLTPTEFRAKHTTTNIWIGAAAF